MKFLDWIMTPLVRRYADRESYVYRILKQRDQAWGAGDSLARAVQQHQAPELREALQAYVDDGGPGMKVY